MTIDLSHVMMSLLIGGLRLPAVDHKMGQVSNSRPEKTNLNTVLYKRVIDPKKKFRI